MFGWYYLTVTVAHVTDFTDRGVPLVLHFPIVIDLTLSYLRTE